MDYTTAGETLLSNAPPHTHTPTHPRTHSPTPTTHRPARRPHGPHITSAFVSVGFASPQATVPRLSARVHRPPSPPFPSSPPFQMAIHDAPEATRETMLRRKTRTNTQGSRATSVGSVGSVDAPLPTVVTNI